MEADQVTTKTFFFILRGKLLWIDGWPLSLDIHKTQSESSQS